MSWLFLLIVVDYYKLKSIILASSARVKPAFYSESPPVFSVGEKRERIKVGSGKPCADLGGSMNLDAASRILTIDAKSTGVIVALGPSPKARSVIRRSSKYYNRRETVEHGFKEGKQ